MEKVVPARGAEMLDSGRAICCWLMILAILGLFVGPVAAVMPEWGNWRALNGNAGSDGNVGDLSVDLVSDGKGNWVSVWSAGVLNAANRDADIFVSRSSDNGQTWSEPTILDPYATGPPESKDDAFPKVATDGQGNWIAVWQSSDDRGVTIGGDLDILVSRSGDNGETWSVAVPLNSDAAFDGEWYDLNVSLAYDGVGTWTAVWEKGANNTESDVVVSRSTDNGESWSDLDVLCESMSSDGQSDQQPGIASDGAGTAVVVWSMEAEEGGFVAGYDVYAAMSTNGIDWSAPVSVYNDASGVAFWDEMPSVATNRRGRWAVVWYNWDWLSGESNIMMSKSDDNGGTWSSATYVNDREGEYSGEHCLAVISSDNVNGWMIVWQSDERLSASDWCDDDILFAYSDDNAGSWSEPWLVNSYGIGFMERGEDRRPAVAHAGYGRWYTAWTSTFDFSGDLGDDNDLMIAQTCVPMREGDYSCNIDLSDYAALQQCFADAGPVESDCRFFDVDVDDDVDWDDYVTFEAFLVGPAAE